MNRNIILFNLLLIIINFCLSVDSIDSEIGVPVLLWSKTDNDLRNNNKNIDLINSQSSVNQINYNLLRDDYLKSETIVVFLQNHLSIEQFSTEDNNKFKTIKNIINDQSLEPLLLTDVLRPTEALKEFKNQDINQINVNNGNKIVINLPKDSLVENDKLIGDLINKIGHNLTESALYLITGRQNSNIDISDNQIEDSEDSHHFGRHILASELSLTEGPIRLGNNTEDKERLLTVQKCIFLFMTTVTVYHYNESLENSSIPIATFDTLGDNAIVGNASHCWEINANTSTQIEEAVLHITFQNASETNGLKLELTLNIDSPHYKNKTDFWRVKNGTANLSGVPEPMEYNLIVSDITSEYNFSYSCSKLRIMSILQNKTDGSGLTQISLVFNNFQLQPFENPHNRNITGILNARYYVFTDSFDCQTWMTTPLWMGLLSLLLFFTILFTGVYFLLQVNTPDRFENPKGKPLMITSFDE